MSREQTRPAPVARDNSPVGVADAASPKNTPSPAAEEAEGVVPLWGTWEWWCDVPAKRVPGKAPSAVVAAAPAITTTTAPTSGGQSPIAGCLGSAPNAAAAAAAPAPTSWIDAIKSLGLFDTAQGFWGIHNCVLPPSRLPNGANYYLFRQNIPPMWEHEANRRGGKWVAQFTPDQAAECDKSWVELCVACMGEQVPGPEEEVCGVAVSKRRNGFRLALWTRTSSSEGVQTNMGFFVKVLLGLRTRGSLNYVPHCTALLASANSAAAAAAAAAPGATDPRSSPTEGDRGNSPTTESGSKSRAFSPVAAFPCAPGAAPAASEPLYSL